MKKLIVIGMVLCVLTVLVGSASAYTFTRGGSDGAAQTLGSWGTSSSLSGAAAVDGGYAIGGHISSIGGFTAGQYSGIMVGTQSSAESDGISQTGAESCVVAGAGN